MIDDLKPGDIAFKHPDIFPDYFPAIIDHCLLFIEYNTSTEKYVFIEAGIHNSCVQYRNETKENIKTNRSANIFIYILFKKIIFKI